MIAQGLLASPAAADDTNILGLPAKAVEAKGTLLIAGGGATPGEVYDEFVRLAGGKKARIVLVPSAHDYEGLEQIRYRFSGWFSYEVASFQFLDTNSRETADKDEFVKPLLEATGVWFSGGDQTRLTERYLGTKVQAALYKILERGGVVGGISAGAAVQSSTMMRDGWTEPELGDGLGLASKAVIDTHFSERGRHTRLLRALDERPGFVGLGLDEGAALVVQGSHLKAIGRSTVTVCVSSREDQPVVLHRLKSGQEADLIKVTADKPAKQPNLNVALERRRQ
jgi:cyanophycinase